MGWVVVVVGAGVVLVGWVVVVASVLDGSTQVDPQCWCEVLVSSGNRRGPCHGPSGEIVCGVAPVTTSNCTGTQVFVKVSVVTPAWEMVNRCDSSSVWGHASPVPGIW